jgi:hypothetical protein
MEWSLAFRIIERGLKLWNTKEGRKYLEEVIKLKQEWHNEFNRKDRSDLALDRILERLRIIGETFAESTVGNDATSSSKQ